jgi:hypothetical protein
MDKVIEIILTLLSTQFNLVLEWIKDQIHDSESGLDDKLVKVGCYAIVTFATELRELAAKSETKIDDNILEKVIRFAELEIDPKVGEREVMQAAVEAGLVVRQ